MNPNPRKALKKEMNLRPCQISCTLQHETKFLSVRALKDQIFFTVDRRRRRRDSSVDDNALGFCRYLRGCQCLGVESDNCTWDVL